MKILVLNGGSSSLKFQVIESETEQVLAKGLVEKIGSAAAIVNFSAPGKEPAHRKAPVLDHRGALAEAFALLHSGEVISSHEDIAGVGHRIVHGGYRLSSSARMDDDVVRAIEEAVDLAPLHNPANLKCYRGSLELLPKAVHVAVFDTAFHHDLPPRAALFALPYDLYTRERLRRYGFHGVSYSYIARRYAEIRGGRPEHFRLIVCHLGNGCSICAIDRGRSVDISMGLTPLEGLVMGTRGGDLDSGLLLHLLRHGRTVDDLEKLLNHGSGLLGVSGLTNDMRDLLDEADRGNERCRLAVEMFCYRARKYIGAYLAALGGADAVIFTAGIGENAARIRAGICDGLGVLGIRLDAAKNDATRGTERDISDANSPIRVWVLPTDEELMIARETAALIR